MGRAKEKRRERLNKKFQKDNVVSEDFLEQRKEKLPVILPKTEAQEEYIKALIQNKLIIASGPAGTGKTKIAAHKAAEWLRMKEIDKVIVARPFVQMGKTAGFRPGTTEEKLYPYVRNILDNMKLVLKESYQYYVDKKIIEIQALEDIRGRSFDEPSILILDECQNSTPEEIKSVVTRVGEGCKLILCGDPDQKDIAGQSGLEYIREIIFKYDIRDSDCIDFTNEDIVRSGMVKDFVIAFQKENKN